MSEIAGRIDRAKWGRPHWAILAAVAMGYLMWGVIGSLAYLFYPSVKALWFLVAPILSQLAGDLGLSYLSDRMLGRKTTFYFTMLLYAAGALTIVFSTAFASKAWYYPHLVAFGIILGYIGIEGEVPVSRAYLAETMPLAEREKVLVLEPNFDNLGAALAALVGFLVYGAVGSRYVELQVLGYFAFTLTLAAFAVRYMVPESARWLAHVGKVDEAKKSVEGLALRVGGTSEARSTGRVVGFWSRFAFLLALSVSQYLTYGLMAFVVADYYFSGNTVNLIAFVANLAATVTGFVVPLFITRVSIRKYSFASYLGGALTMVPILYSLNALGSNMVLFYVLLALNMAFSEMAWTVRTILEPLLLPTRRRAFLIGLVRSGHIFAYTASIYFTAGFTIAQFVEYNLVLWVVGVLATLYWLLRGYEVHGVSIEQTSGEALAAVQA